MNLNKWVGFKEPLPDSQYRFINGTLDFFKKLFIDRFNIFLRFKIPAYTDKSSESIFSNALVREITGIIILKLFIIFFIKYAFFSDPISMDKPQESVANQFGFKDISQHPTLENEL